jgi:hypothetical protein
MTLMNGALARLLGARGLAGARAASWPSRATRGDPCFALLSTLLLLGIMAAPCCAADDDQGGVTPMSLADKGLTYEQCLPEKKLTLGRPRPDVPFSRAPRRPSAPGSITRRLLPVVLKEDAGVARPTTLVTFGLPLPRGGVFDLAHFRVLSPRGAAVPAQFVATSFWPDGSLRWVLVDMVVGLGANAEETYRVEFGSEVAPAPAGVSHLQVKETKEKIQINTGPLQVSIDKVRFNLLSRVASHGEQLACSAPEGVRLVDEQGAVFTVSARPPKRVTVEEVGPVKVVLRAEGDYADPAGRPYMSYVTRLTFREGSSRVTIQHTHINTYLRTEFTDFTSLTMPFRVPGLRRAHTYWDTADHAGAFTASAATEERTSELVGGRALRVAQWDERTFRVADSEGTVDGRQYSGVLRVEGDSGPLGIAAHEFWQRWPKAFRLHDDQVDFDLLPQQPGPDYGRDLPGYYLQYPFVEGKYRSKWGMAFTQRITLDFSGTTPAAELAAEADLPVIAVLPGEWYAETKALGEMAPPVEGEFDGWDAAVGKAFAGHLRRKAERREYGYSNYGDWYGERQINWGNNEYDLAHGLFMQFARSGCRDYARLALAAARHQADADTCHAYPDERFLGANLSHAIAHTGTWDTDRRAWSVPYDVWQYTARSGHVWADGLMDAWYLAGDAWAMEAALAEGEHIVWSMSREFDELGTHERDAGWALKAVLAVYRGTLDPLYLEAAQRIAAVPLREQKFDQGGAWPHVLPSDHADKDHQGAVGNNLFLIGILLSGLKDLHEQTHEPAVEKSLVAGADWVLLSWDETRRAWPYSASPTGEPMYDQWYVGMNNLVCESLPYVSRLTGDPRYAHVARAAFEALTEEGLPADGKSLGQHLYFAPSIMGGLQAAASPRRPPL